MAFGFFDFFKKDKDEEQSPESAPQTPPAEERPAPPPPEEEEQRQPEPPVEEEPVAGAPGEEASVPESSFDDLASLLDDEDEDTSSADDILGLADEEPEPANALPPEPPADTIYVPAEKIMPALPDDYLQAPADELIAQHGGQQDFIFSFNRSDLMYSLSRGKLEMSVGDLASKIPMEVFRDDLADYADQVLQLPLEQVVPLIPPEWMQRGDQDESKEKIINEWQDFFQDLGTPAPPAPEEEEEEEEEAYFEEEASLEDPTMVDQRAPAEAMQDSMPTEAYMDEEDEPEPEPVEESVGYAEEEEEEVEADFTEDLTYQEEPAAAGPQVELGITEPELPADDYLPDEEEEDVFEEETQGLAAPYRPAEEEVEEEIHVPPPTPQEFAEELPAVEEPEPVAEEPVEEPEPEPEPEPVAEEPVEEPAAYVEEPEPVEPEPAPVEAAELAKEIAQVDEAEQDLAQLSSFDAVDPAQVTERVFGEQRKKLELHTKSTSAPDKTTEKPWRSNNPNGVNINHEDQDKLAMLTGVGQHIAQLIINYRQENGPFTSLHELLNIEGVGRHTFRSMTGISPRSDLRQAELEVNDMLGIDSETIALPEIARRSLDKLNLLGIFLTSEDGFVLTSASKNDDVAKLQDIFAGIAPQIFKRCRRHIAQGRLPDIDMMTCYISKYAVTFAGSEDVLITCVHKQAHPSTRDLRALRRVGRELVWHFSVRAII